MYLFSVPSPILWALFVTRSAALTPFNRFSTNNRPPHPFSTQLRVSSACRSSSRSIRPRTTSTIPRNASASTDSTVDRLIKKARTCLQNQDTDMAFACLAKAHAQNPQARGLTPTFEAYFRQQIVQAEHPADANPNTIQDNRQEKRILAVNPMDRMGLATLLVDKGHYQEAAQEFQKVLEYGVMGDNDNDESSSRYTVHRATKEKAASLLFKTKATLCDWNNIQADGQALLACVHNTYQRNQQQQRQQRNDVKEDFVSVPAVHPYEALMWPCMSIQDANLIAGQYAQRAAQTVYKYNLHHDNDNHVHPHNSRDDLLNKQRSTTTVYNDQDSKSLKSEQTRSIKVGYLSNDFTSKHPLAFLMQDFFRFHDEDRFQVFIYSLHHDDEPSSSDDENNVDDKDEETPMSKIKRSAHSFQVVGRAAGQSSTAAAAAIRQDDVDVLIDLTGYTGTSVGAEIMAARAAPVQVGHMGFPASSAAPFMDYLVCDETVVPSWLRHHYQEALIYMPHCFFANSHKFLNIDKALESGDRKMNSSSAPASALPIVSRKIYGLPEDAFVFCCHNRAEKLDASTFRSWLRVLRRVPHSVLWLLRTGKQPSNCEDDKDAGDGMMENLQRLARNELGQNVADRIIFCDQVTREEHLERLKLADLFLDTPAYNAHTTGCDALRVGLPMVSLLRESPGAPPGQVATDKMASRVGASFLKTLHLPELIASTMDDYERIMEQCANDPIWSAELNHRLSVNREKSPLFDTERWVRNWEACLKELAMNQQTCNRKSDVYVLET